MKNLQEIMAFVHTYEIVICGGKWTGHRAW